MESVRMSRPTWDDTFLEICGVLAKRSKDENTKIGCVIVGPDHEIRSVGYNCFPRGIDDNVQARQERPEKYAFFAHAERNAIFNAARIGVPLLGSTCYLPLLPCSDCTRGLIQSGITEVVCGSNIVPERWAEGCGPSLAMLKEAGVMIRLPNTTWRLELKIGSEWGVA
jgi:dCMP deaminase